MLPARPTDYILVVVSRRERGLKGWEEGIRRRERGLKGCAPGEKCGLVVIF